MFNRLQGLFSPSAAETDVAATVAALGTDTTIVDVREADEWASGHIAGAVHIPLGSLAARAGELDPARPVITVCRSGRRSLEAVTLLNAAGIFDARSMAGGMMAWEKAGQRVKRS